MQVDAGILTIIILLVTLVVSLLATAVARIRRQSIVLRHHPAYAAMPLLVSESLEADRTLHFSFGSVIPSGTTTPLMVAAAEVFTLLATRAAVGAQTPLLTMSEVSALPLAYDVLRRAYRLRGRTDQFRNTAVQWYPDGPRSLAFAAALTAAISDEKVSANIFMGSFGPELALIMDAAHRRGQGAIAASDQLEGQAVAYALSDEELIGEEMFAGGAYLGGSAAQVGGVVALDMLRVLLIAGLLLMVADRLTGGVYLSALLRGGG
ncbi:MAG: hypothetical protein KJ065_01305 [Anaerolineae bacterium]|nr:hypothetical protein [Anaerolineae bacterium]